MVDLNLNVKLIIIMGTENVPNKKTVFVRLNLKNDKKRRHTISFLRYKETELESHFKKKKPIKWTNSWPNR